MDKNAEYFNKMLSLQCPQATDKDDIFIFWFYLHCTSVEVIAKRVKEYDSEKGYAEYEVISFKNNDAFESDR